MTGTTDKPWSMNQKFLLVEYAAVGQGNKLIEQLARECREYQDSGLKDKVLNVLAEDLGVLDD